MLIFVRCVCVLCFCPVVFVVVVFASLLHALCCAFVVLKCNLLCLMFFFCLDALLLVVLCFFVYVFRGACFLFCFSLPVLWLCLYSVV